MTDENGREYVKVVSIGQQQGRLTQVKLQCGHEGFGSRPRVGAELRCKSCERNSQRLDMGDNRRRTVTRQAA